MTFFDVQLYIFVCFISTLVDYDIINFIGKRYTIFTRQNIVVYVETLGKPTLPSLKSYSRYVTVSDFVNSAYNHIHFELRENRQIIWLSMVLEYV